MSRARAGVTGDRETIIDRLHRHAARRGDHPALIFDEGAGPVARLTYRELFEQIGRAAAGLAEQGVAGRPVALLFAPGIDFVVAFFACLAIGSVAVPLAPIGRRRERIGNLLPVVADCQAAALLVDDAMAGQYGELEAALAPTGVRYLTMRELDRAVSFACTRKPDPADLAVLQYTSGSTSSPKGVMISHGNIMANQRMIRESFGHDEASDFVGWAPHFHDQGLFGNIMQPLYLGATCVLTAPSTFVRRPLVWLELIDRYRAHTSGGPNFAFELCVEQARARGLPDLDLSCWKVAFNGAEPIHARTLDAFAEMFAPLGFRREALFPCYGLAESTVVTSCGPRDRAPVVRSLSAGAIARSEAAEVEAGADGLRQVCCGPTMRDAEVVVVDPATREPLPEHRIGEIWLAGPHIARGYWNRPEASTATFGARLADGRGPFLRTGDLGFLKPEGLYVVSRLKDLLIVRGRNYAPSDIEQLWPEISEQPGQAIAAALQVEHNGREHVVLVTEVSRPQRQSASVDGDLARMFREIRRLAIERLDLSITDIVVVSPGALPRTTSGKIRRAATRDALLGGLLPVIAGTGPLMNQLALCGGDILPGRESLGGSRHAA